MVEIFGVQKRDVTDGYVCCVYLITGRSHERERERERGGGCSMQKPVGMINLYGVVNLSGANHGVWQYMLEIDHKSL